MDTRTTHVTDRRGWARRLQAAEHCVASCAANTLQCSIGTKEWCTGRVLGYDYPGSPAEQKVVKTDFFQSCFWTTWDAQTNGFRPFSARTSSTSGTRQALELEIAVHDSPIFSNQEFGRRSLLAWISGEVFTSAASVDSWFAQLMESLLVFVYQVFSGR